jgi:nucleoside 2-deoxyribosyltransferase
MSGKKRIYIAGPDLFLPDWPERAARVTALCAEHGLAAVLPVPATPLTWRQYERPMGSLPTSRHFVDQNRTVGP